jgi:hypothetical protein
MQALTDESPASPGDSSLEFGHFFRRQQRFVGGGFDLSAPEDGDWDVAKGMSATGQRLFWLSKLRPDIAS